METEASERKTTDWGKIIRRCNESGLSKTEWCRRHGIAPKTFFYHQRKVREGTVGTGTSGGGESNSSQAQSSIASAVTLAELPLQAGRAPEHDEIVPVAVIRHGGTEIAVSGGISPEFLSLLLERICHAQ